MEKHLERRQFRHREWNAWAEDLMEKLFDASFQTAPAQDQLVSEQPEQSNDKLPAKRPRARG